MGKIEAAIACLLDVAENGSRATSSSPVSPTTSTQGKRYRTTDLDRIIAHMQSDLLRVKETMYAMFRLEDSGDEGVFPNSTHDHDAEPHSEKQGESSSESSRS